MPSFHRSSLVSCAAILAVVLLPGSGTAQEMRFIESFDYGLTSQNLIEGREAGGGWIGPWHGNRQIIQGIGTYWPMDGSGLGIPIIPIYGRLINGATFAATPPPAVAAERRRQGANPGEALKLDRLNFQYMDVSGTASAGAQSYANVMRGTIALWFKTGNNVKQVMFSASNVAQTKEFLSLGIDRGQVYFEVEGNLYQAIQQTKTPDGYDDDRWHHVAVVCPGSGMIELYVDGVRPRNTTEFPEGFFGNIPAMDTMLIGAIASAAAPQGVDYFDGLLDEVAVWGTPLTPADIAALAAGQAPAAQVSGPFLPGSGPHVTTGSLTSPAYQTHGLTSYGGKYIDTSGDRARRPMATSFGGLGGALSEGLSTKINLQYHYVSFLVRRTDNGEPIRPGWLQFTDDRRTSLVLGWNSGGIWEGGIDYPLTEAQPEIPVMQDATTYFVVCRIEATRFLPGDKVWAKFYLPNDVVHNSDTELMDVGSGTNNWNFFVEEGGLSAGNDMWILHGGNGLGAGVLELDEIRIGRSWDIVTKPYMRLGCGGAQMSRTGRPALGSTISVDLAGGRPNNIGVLMVGIDYTMFGAATLPTPLEPLVGAIGCELNVSPLIFLQSATNASGQASQSIRVRPNPIWLNAPLYCQWLAFDPNPRASWHNPSGLIFSPGLELYFEK